MKDFCEGVLLRIGMIGSTRFDRALFGTRYSTFSFKRLNSNGKLSSNRNASEFAEMPHITTTRKEGLVANMRRCLHLNVE